MLKRAKYDRIVMLQDCIHIEPDTLEKIATLPNEMYTFPVGQTLSFDKEPDWDWRKGREGLIQAEEWEADFACAPTQAFFDVGGYDEDFNNGWSFDNVEVAYRIERSGRQFYCTNTVHGVALRHDVLTPNPFRTTRELNDQRARKTKERCLTGDYRLDYLK